MLNKIKKLLGMEHEIDSKNVRRMLASMEYFDDIKPHTYYITQVKVFQKATGIRVMVRTHMPGYFIGAKGSNIALIRDYFKRKLEQDVKIFIVEEDMFSTCYD